MRRRIRGVRKLPEHDPALGGGYLVRLFDRARHARRAVGQYDFRAVSLEQFPALRAHRFGHGENNAVTARRAYRRKPYARVSARRLYDDRPRLKQSALFRIDYHGERGSVLDAARGIEKLELCYYPRLCSALRAVPLKLRRGRSADKPLYSVVNIHYYYLDLLITKYFESADAPSKL